MLSLLAPRRLTRAAPEVHAPSLARAYATLGMADADAPTVAQIRTANRGLVYACERLRSNGVASGMVEAVAARRVRPGESKPLEAAHPWARLLAQPNPSLSPFLLWKWIQEAKDLSRGAFLIVERNGARVPVALHPVFPAFGDVAPVGDTAGGVAAFVFLRADGQRTTYPAEDVVWIRHPHPVSPYESASLLEAAAYEIDANLYAHVYRRDLFRDGGAPNLQITTDQELTAAQAAAAADNFRANYLGGRGVAKVPVFGKGSKLLPVGLSPDDMEMAVSLGMTDTDIMRVFGVMEGMLSDKSNRANAEQAVRTFAQWTLQAEVNANCDQLTTDLRRAFGAARSASDTVLVVLPPDVVPLDPELLMRQDEAALRTGKATVNEIREREGKAKHGPEGDRPLVNAALVPLDVLAPPPAVEGEEVAVPEEALSGIQVTSAVNIVKDVAAGALPRETGVQMLVTFFHLSADAAEALMGTVGNGFAPVVPVFAPVPPFDGEEDGEERGLPWNLTPLLALVKDHARPYRAEDEDPLIVPWRALDTRRGKHVPRVQAAAAALIRRMGEEVVSKLSAARSVRKGVPGEETPEVTAGMLLDVGRWADEFADGLTPTLAAALRDGFAAAMANVEAAGGITLTFDPDTPGAKAALSRVVDLQRSVPETAKGILETALRDGLAAGEDVDALTSRVRSLFSEMEEWEARRVAVTSSTNAFEGGQVEAFAEAGVDRKRWLSERDDKVRPEHDAMDGEEVGVDEAFSNGLDYPQEPNCRCTMLPVIGPERAAKGRRDRTWLRERNDALRAAYPALRDAHGREVALDTLGTQHSLSPDRVADVLKGR